MVIKATGLGAVVAVSFARIFFRNAINIGLPVFVCDTSGMETGHDPDLEAGTGRDITPAPPSPPPPCRAR